MKEQFINCYPLSKTLQFSLIPVGKTDDNFNKKLLLERDKQRAENYEKVKGYIDRFHKEYIESVLVNARVEKSMNMRICIGKQQGRFRRKGYGIIRK